MIVNINHDLIEALNTATGYPVAPDVYTGTDNKYITFTYADERGAMFGDNDEVAVTADVKVIFNAPRTFNYFADKAKIKNALKGLGFENISIESYLEASGVGTEYTRKVIFDAEITTFQ